MRRLWVCLVQGHADYRYARLSGASAFRAACAGPGMKRRRAGDLGRMSVRLPHSVARTRDL